MENLHLEQAKEIIKKPKDEAEADLNAIRANKGDAEADAVIAQFSAAIRETDNENQN